MAIAAVMIPVGGSKWSGIGIERGEWSTQDMTQLKTTYGQRPTGT